MKKGGGMSRIIHGLYSWLAVNLLLLFPALILLTTDVPQQIELNIAASQRLSVKIGDADGVCRSRNVNASTCAQKVRFFLPSDFDGTVVSVAAEGNVPFELSGLSIVYRFALGRDYHLSPTEAGYACSPSGAWRLVLPRRLILAGIVGEMILLGLAVLLCGFVKRESLFSRRAVLTSVAVAAVVSFFVTVIVPLQSVLANASLYRFSVGGFLLVAIGYALIGTLILSAGLLFSRPSFGYFIHTVLLSFITFEYLNTGVLAIGEPQLNGEISYWLNENLKFRSVIIAGSVVGGFVVAHWWIRKCLHWVCLALAVMFGASLLDVRSSHDAVGKGSPMAAGFCSKLDAVQHTVHSGRRNVMLIVLDATSAVVAEKVFAEDPQLRESFPGFIDFANNIGVHSRTATSMAALMGGERFDPDGSLTPGEFVNTPLTAKSLVWDFISNNVPCSVVWGSAVHGYSSFAPAGKASEPEEGLYFRCRADTAPALSLFETVRFRMMPFAIKYEGLVMTLNGMRSYVNVSAESLLFPILARAKIDDGLVNNFEHFHTHGAHPAYDMDKNGNAVVPQTSDQGYYDMAYFVLHRLAELMKAYRERGIYDNSMIVVMGDHGRVDAQDEKARPMLWVKPFRATGPMAVSKVPTWSLKVNPLLRQSRENDLTAEQVVDVLRSSERIYQHMGWFEWDDIVDYYYDESGNVVKEVRRNNK